MKVYKKDINSFEEIDTGSLGLNDIAKCTLSLDRQIAVDPYSQNNSISTVASFVSPYKESRKAIREMVKNNIVVYVRADIETCKSRDTKGKYKKALSGEYQNFTGVNDIYEEPQHAEIVIDTDILSVEQSTNEIVQYVRKKCIK